MSVLGGILLISALAGEVAPQVTTPETSQPMACAQVISDAATDGGAAGEICAGDDAARLANVALQDPRKQMRQWQAAAEHYRRAASLASKAVTKALALESLAGIYETSHLNDAKQLEATLREIISLTPGDLAPVYRLAKAQEEQGLLDAAEDTLLGARHSQPENIQPNRLLAQFYARRATALHQQETQKEPKAAGSPGEPDESGIYRIGGSIRAPARISEPQYPADARAAGITGTVVAEIVVDPSGNVSDAKVIRSIPILDEAALQAVHNWRYAPTIVNGQAVPVRMVVTVNFSLPPGPPATPASAPPPPPR